MTCSHSALGTYKRRRHPQGAPVLGVLMIVFCHAISGFAQSQPTSMSFSPAQGYAGNDCYVVTVGNGANMNVDFQYTVNGQHPQPDPMMPDATIQMDSNGTTRNCLTGNPLTGPYVFQQIKNHLNQTWVPLTPNVTFQLLPARPVSLTFSPSTIAAGQSFTMTVGGMSGGTGVYLDVQDTFNNGPTETWYNWPSIDSNGQANIPTTPCATRIGQTVFTAIESHLNQVAGTTNPTGWLIFPSPQPLFTANAPPAPSVNPNNVGSGQVGTSTSITMTGSNLCNVSLSTTWNGLSFTNIAFDSPYYGTWASATFNIASTTNVGRATVTLTATGGQTTFTFDVTNNSAPMVTAINPASEPPGWSGPVTLTGSNLVGATLSTSWNGLSITNPSSPPAGTSLTAIFTIAATAVAGYPPIIVTNSVGSTTTTLFSITALPPVKDYVYFGGRLVAIDTRNAATAPQPPSAPANLTGSAASSTQVNLSWNASTPGSLGLAGYRAYRNGTPVNPTLNTTTSFPDSGLTALTEYSYYVVAVDVAGNSSAPSATINVTTQNAIPAAPSSLSLTADSQTQITLRWLSNSTNESGFKIDRQVGSGIWAAAYAQVAAGVTQFRDTNLTASTTYSYRVWAFNGSGNSATTNVASTTTLANPPGTPTGLRAITVGSTQVNLTWTASTGAVAQYRIERSQGTGYTQIATSTTTSYSDSTAVSGVAYLYRVRAVDSTGLLSGYSNFDLATTIVFADEPLCSPSDQPPCTPWMLIKAQHIIDLRLAVNAVRITAGLAPVNWTDATLAGVVVKAVHFQELRTDLSAALIALGFPAPSFTDPTINAGQTPIRKVHIEELRRYAK